MVTNRELVQRALDGLRRYREDDTLTLQDVLDPESYPIALKAIRRAHDNIVLYGMSPLDLAIVYLQEELDGSH
jgi:hypothetical protein